MHRIQLLASRFALPTLAAALLVLVAAPRHLRVAAQSAPVYDLTGRVTDAAGAPIPGVTVILSTGHNGSRAAVTRADGTYSHKYTADTYVAIAPAKNGYAFNPSTQIYSSNVAGPIAGSSPHNFEGAPFPLPSTFQFAAPAYNTSEGAGSVTVTVTRGGFVYGGALVSYRTVDETAPVRCDAQGASAYARCDYQTTVNTLYFVGGETTKTFTVPVIDDAHAEGAESFRLELFSPVGGTLDAQSAATVTITDNDSGAGPNPVLDSRFFLRQHYLDFLSREPDAAGFDTWLGVLDGCAPGDTRCDRVQVSSSFFGSPEFQLKGLYVFKFYKVALGRLPTYAEIVADMQGVTGQFAEEVEAKRAALADAWIERAEFKARYPSTLTPEAYVDKLLQTEGVTLTGAVTRDTLAADMRSGAKTRAEVLRAIVEHPAVEAKEYNPAFVAMQYYGYLRRAPEEPGYSNWLAQINARPGDYRSMVQGFIDSTEYKLRFGQP